MNNRKQLPEVGQRVRFFYSEENINNRLLHAINSFYDDGERFIVCKEWKKRRQVWEYIVYCQIDLDWWAGKGVVSYE